MVTTLLEHFNLRRIIIFSRDEYKQSLMQEKFNPKKYPNMRYFIGDIRDYERLEFALRGVDFVFHAAALKQVPAIEYNPYEAVKTNIIGSQNVIRASISNNVTHVMAISTDKCVDPTNLYGGTKLCAEKLFINANILSPTTKFCAARYGNVLGSRGSVIHIFKDMHDKGNVMKVTDDRMTRFTVTLEQAINFVLMGINLSIGGEIFVPILPSYNIMQLVEIFGGQHQVVGIRPGEKLHELMLSEYESHLAYKFNDFYIVTPLTDYNVQRFAIDEFTKVAGNGTKCEDGIRYSSGQNTLIETDELKTLVQNIINI
jgi:UDP-N-acetylglucosamine 4,6-dehydratase